VLHERAHLGSSVEVGKAADSTGMGGQDGRRQGAGFDAGRRKYGKGYGQGAFAESRQIMDGGNPPEVFLFTHKKDSFYSNGLTYA
jgi:hypothetical protein